MTLLDPRMTNTPSPTDEDRELDRILRVWENGEMDAAGTIEDLVKVADRLLSDRAKLEGALRGLRHHPKIAGCRPIGATTRFGDLRARFDAADTVLNRSTDRAT